MKNLLVLISTLALSITLTFGQDDSLVIIDNNPSPIGIEDDFSGRSPIKTPLTPSVQPEEDLDYYVEEPDIPGPQPKDTIVRRYMKEEMAWILIVDFIEWIKTD